MGLRRSKEVSQGIKLWPVTPVPRRFRPQNTYYYQFQNL